MINNQSGQTLIETLVALAMAVIIMSAIALTMITAINSGDFAKQQNLAAQYAQQGLELVKQQAQDGSALLPLGSFCLNGTATDLNSSILYTCNINNDANKVAGFVRQVQTGLDASKCGGAVYVAVTTKWTDGKCTSGAYCHNVTLDSCVSDNR